MRIVDLLMAFPGILLALLVITVLGRGLVNVMLAVGIADIPAFARLVRGSVLLAREHVYVEAARATGAADRSVLFRHVLPNVFAPMLVVATLEVGNAILIASSLRFLGLGAQAPSPEWGAMLAAGREYIRTAWWLTVFPGVAIAAAVLAVNMLGDGLRDALDPKLQVSQYNRSGGRGDFTRQADAYDHRTVWTGNRGRDSCRHHFWEP